MIAAAVANAGLSAAQREVVRVYLDELLSGKYSNGDLCGPWRKTGADIRLGSRKGATKFLQTMRSVIETFDHHSHR